MTGREEKILRAAKAVFARYGVAKTTMSDIASEAGVARQTVYNAFPGKPDILRAATRLATCDFQDEMRIAWQDAQGLEGKVDAFFELGPIRWFEMMSSSPQLAEIFDGIGTHAAAEVAEAAKTWTAMFVQMFKDERVQLIDDTVSIEDLAEFLYFSSVNAKYSADTLDVLNSRLRTIKVALLAMIR